MNDVLPADEPLWPRFEDAVAGAMRAYGYSQIRTPIVEDYVRRRYRRRHD
jgi:histidyl-tRNA synthetase